MSENFKEKDETINCFNERMRDYNPEDVGKTAKEGTEKFSSLEDCIPSPLKELWDNIKELIELLKDYGSKRYRDIPVKSIIAIGAAIAYFVSPIDVIPDTIPIVGFFDDALVLKFALDLVLDDLEAYKLWKDGRTTDSDE